MAAPTASFLKNHTADTAVFQGRQVLTLQPKTGASGHHILYIHGGGWGTNIGPENYDDLYAQVMDRTGATITLPDYGLAPYYSYREAYSLFQVVYDDLVARVGAENIIIMGESAGGNLSMGFTQKLKIENRPLPAQTILLFPALDATFSNPAIDKLQDPILRVKLAREAVTVWADGTDLSFYQISPINGPLEGLPPISVFIGGRDITSPDCLKLRDMMNAKCQPLNFYEYPQMIHGWMSALPNAPESKKTWEQIANLINNGQ
nr:alpha/beta hydrolase [Pontibacter qinzhouensis]